MCFCIVAAFSNAVFPLLKAKVDLFAEAPSGYGGDVEVVMVPLRVPSSLPPSQGVLRLHSQKACHPFVENKIEDEKCPENCTTGKCIEIPFQLASSIRQILLITDKTHYRKGETGKKKKRP